MTKRFSSLTGKCFQGGRADRFSVKRSAVEIVKEKRFQPWTRCGTPPAMTVEKETSIMFIDLSLYVRLTKVRNPFNSPPRVCWAILSHSFRHILHST